VDKFEEAHAMLVSLRSEDHQLVGNLLGNLASVLGQLRGKGEQVREQVLAVRQKAHEVTLRAYGSDSDDTVSSLLSLGNAYRDQAMPEEALARLEEGLEIVRRIHPERNVMEGKLLSSIGLVYSESRLEDALAMYKKADCIFRKILGPDCVQVGQVLVNTAAALREMGKVEDAMMKYGEGLEIMRRTHGDEHRHVVETLYGLGLCKKQAGDSDGYFVCMNEALRIVENLKRRESTGTIDGLLEKLGVGK